MTDDKIIDLKARVAEREATKAIEETGDEGPNVDLVYEFLMDDGTVFQVEGMLMVNSAFFATGRPHPTNGTVDITFAAPVPRVQYAMLLEDDDLTEEAG